jgi:adenylate cyclase
VVAGNVGARERFEYTVIGDAVNEAARLTDLAKGRDPRVLASAGALAAANEAERTYWECDSEAVTLRGRTAPTTLATLR